MEQFQGHILFLKFVVPFYECSLPPWRCSPTQAMASSCLRFLDHTQWRTTVGRTPLDEWSAHRRDLYLTTHNTHNIQTCMPPVGFQPTISRRAAADPHLRPRGHWDRHGCVLCFWIHDTTLGACSLYSNSETVCTNNGFWMLCLCYDPFYFGGRTTTSINLSMIMFM